MPDTTSGPAPDPADPFRSPEPQEAPTPTPGFEVDDAWAGEESGDIFALASSGPPPPPPPKRRLWREAAVGVVSGVLAAALTAGAFLWLNDEPPPAAPGVTIVERVETRIVSPAATESTAAEVAARVLPSIVTVEVRSSTVGEFVADGSGSGVVLDGDGVLVTNQHVIEGASQVRVIFADGRTYPARVIGADPITDLALLQIDATGFTAIELGSTEGMRIGDTAIAVGSPLGLEGGPSVTVGVVSAFGRRVRTGVEEELFGMLQTDAPITRGSSGGALVDIQGRLIGITTAIGVSDVGAEGLGFAIPVELVTRITDDLIADGQTRHAFLGITGTTFFRREADGATVPAGVAVASVMEESAAAAADIQPGDVILSFDGKPVITMEQLVEGLRFYRVDEVVSVEIDRAGTVQTVEVTLMERPEGV